jgi:hypothetical protein
VIVSLLRAWPSLSIQAVACGVPVTRTLSPHLICSACESPTLPQCSTVTQVVLPLCLTAIGNSQTTLSSPIFLTAGFLPKFPLAVMVNMILSPVDYLL